MRPNYVGTSHASIAVHPEKTYAVCVAVRQVQDTSPFGKGKLVKQFRVVYGVYRRSHSGNPVRDVSGNYTPFETIDGQDRFDPVLPEVSDGVQARFASGSRL